VWVLEQALGRLWELVSLLALIEWEYWLGQSAQRFELLPDYKQTEQTSIKQTNKTFYKLSFSLFSPLNDVGIKFYCTCRLSHII
jgi:hypothetical protein